MLAYIERAVFARHHLCARQRDLIQALGKHGVQTWVNFQSISELADLEEQLIEAVADWLFSEGD